MYSKIDYKEKYQKYKSKFFKLKKSVSSSKQSNDSTVSSSKQSNDSTVSSSKQSNNSTISWMNKPIFVPKYNDTTVEVEDQTCNNSELKIIGLTIKNKDGTESVRKKYKWCNGNAINISLLEEGIINKNPKEVVDSLIDLFIGKIFNIEYVDDNYLSPGELTAIYLFKIEVGEGEEKNNIYLRLNFGENQSNKGFPIELGYMPDKNGDVGKKIKYFENFTTEWVWSRGSDTKTEEFVPQHFVDGIPFTNMSKYAWKGTLDGKLIDRDRFIENYDNFEDSLEDIMDKLLPKYTAMINDPNSEENINEFLERFHKLWEKSHKFFKKIMISEEERIAKEKKIEENRKYFERKEEKRKMEEENKMRMKNR